MAIGQLLQVAVANWSSGYGPLESLESQNHCYPHKKYFLTNFLFFFFLFILRPWLIWDLTGIEHISGDIHSRGLMIVHSRGKCPVCMKCPAACCQGLFLPRPKW